MTKDVAISWIISISADIGKVEHRDLWHYEQALSEIREMLEQEEVPSANQWIPVSERLPENNGRYLVTRGLNLAGTTWNRVYIVHYSDLMGLKKEKIFWSGNVGKNDFEHIQDVVAWMPLPETYKGKE